MHSPASRGGGEGDGCSAYVCTPQIGHMKIVFCSLVFSFLTSFTSFFKCSFYLMDLRQKFSEVGVYFQVIFHAVDLVLLDSSN